MAVSQGMGFIIRVKFEKLSRLYDSEFQTKGALAMKGYTPTTLAPSARYGQKL